jgi:type II secretory pathway pseudopilin PulG
MDSRSQNRSGLTILDVVVTIVILVTLVALLLPSVSTPREVARRSQCINNLKQIGLSLMNYHDVHRTLPPGWIASETKGQSSGFGWQFQMLPFFDQAPLYKRFNSKLKLADQTRDNFHRASTILTASRCPADKGEDQATSRWIPEPGTTNYLGNFGVGIPAAWSVLNGSGGTLVDSQHCQGILGPNSRIRIRDVKDGMSNIVLVGERRMSENAGEWPIGRVEGNFNNYWAGIPNADAVSPLVVLATSTGGLIERTPQEIESNTGELPIKGNIPDIRNPERQKSLPYFGINRDTRGELLGDSKLVTAGFSSWHTGGCQMVLGDGTVRFISENIDATVYTNLMRRSDGATLGEF